MIDGGYAEYMVARMEALKLIPEELNSIDAAPLLCAGSTTFGALKSSNLQGGDLVAIHGLGGLGHLAIQYANKLGYRVAGISRGKEKKQLAKKLGVHYFIDSTEVDPAQELMKLSGVKAILCTAPNSKAIAGLVNGLAMNGHMIIITYSGEPMTISPIGLMRGKKIINGWVGGKPQDALKFSVVSEVRPMVATFPLEQATLAFEKMMNSKVHFRAILNIGGE